MSFKSLFNQRNKQVSKADTQAKAEDAVHKAALPVENKLTDPKDSLEKLQLERMRQEIFDKIHALIEERGGIARWGVEVEEILQADVPKIFTGPAGIEFVEIPAGEFMMGSLESGDEQPVHKVTIQNPFYLSKYPVTQRQWEKVMGSTPSRFKGDDLPVECVSWNDAQEFIKKLNQMKRTNEYRLPSEAEWEYACRAGTITRYYFGDDESKFGEYAWYNENSSHQIHPVGQKKPNSWGLYDMNGNVLEWVQDRWHDDYQGAPSDGSFWEDGVSSFRVFRGGSWFNYAKICRSAIRYGGNPGLRNFGLGFRLLRKL